MLVTLGFWIAFAATVVLMVVSLLSGARGRRRLHLVTGPLTVVALAAAVVLTEQLVRRYRFPPAELAVHKVFAVAAAILVLPVVATGLLLVRKPAVRPWHRLAVGLFVAGALVATGTGIWIWTLATPR